VYSLFCASVSKGIVELHEGHISVFSDGEGLGSTFIVEIPVRYDDAPGSPRTRAPSSVAAAATVVSSVQSQSGLSQASSWLRAITRRKIHVADRLLRVLVADDSVLNRKYLCRLLRPKCEVLKEAVDGAEAVRMVLAAAEGGTSYDVVLMDNQMPVMDGPSASREIRSAGYKGLVLGITGDVLPADIEHFQKCGADRVLAKPIDIPALEDILHRNISSHTFCTFYNVYIFFST